MSIGQLLSFATFVEIINQYNLFTPIPLALLLILLQLVAIPSLLQIPLSPAMATVSRYSIVLIPLLWSFIAFQAILRGITIDNCGCFGAYFSQPLNWSVIVQDTVFIAWGIYSFYVIRYSKN